MACLRNSAASGRNRFSDTGVLQTAPTACKVDSVIEKYTAAWVLECGCEPGFQHCKQCDARRVERTAWKKENSSERKAERAEIVELLKKKGYPAIARMIEESGK